MELNKVCRSCGCSLPLASFCKNKQTKDGLSCYCRECSRQKYQEFCSLNPEKIREVSAKTREKTREKRNAYQRAWHARNKEKEREYRIRNKQSLLEKSAEFYRLNKGRYDSNASIKRRKAQTPPWANQDEIKLIYQAARDRSRSSGTPHEVDHIVPLLSKFVCGLHCEDNLRVIPRTLNRYKASTYWPCMPDIGAQ